MMNIYGTRYHFQNSHQTQTSYCIYLRFSSIVVEKTVELSSARADEMQKDLMDYSVVNVLLCAFSIGNAFVIWLVLRCYATWFADWMMIATLRGLLTKWFKNWL